MTTSNDELTAEEKAAVAALKRLQKIWPKTLWIFVGGNEALTVLKTRNGERVMGCNGVPDQELEVANIKIPADGGAW